MQILVSQPYLFIINVSSVIIHSIINFIYIKDFDTVSIGEEGIHHMPSQKSTATNNSADSRGIILYNNIKNTKSSLLSPFLRKWEDFENHQFIGVIRHFVGVVQSKGDTPKMLTWAFRNPTLDLKLI